MSVIRGCQEGKVTPKLEFVSCPDCGEEVEVFIRMGGEIGVTGTLVAEETCEKCGHVFPEGTPLADLK